MMGNNLTPGKIDTLITNLNVFAYANALKPVKTGKRVQYLYLLGSYQGIVYDFFQQNKLLVWFDAESAEIPANYADLYHSEFRQVINAWTGADFKIGQLTSKLENNTFSYEIFVQFKNGPVYKHAYTEESTDWYEPQRLVKLLNLCLIPKGDTRRLVQADTDDQTVMFLFMDPARITPFLDQLHIASWPIHRSNEFQDQEGR